MIGRSRSPAIATTLHRPPRSLDPSPRRREPSWTGSSQGFRPLLRDRSDQRPVRRPPRDRSGTAGSGPGSQLPVRKAFPPGGRQRRAAVRMPCEGEPWGGGRARPDGCRRHAGSVHLLEPPVRSPPLASSPRPCRTSSPRSCSVARPVRRCRSVWQASPCTAAILSPDGTGRELARIWHCEWAAGRWRRRCLDDSGNRPSPLKRQPKPRAAILHRQGCTTPFLFCSFLTLVHTQLIRVPTHPLAWDSNQTPNI